MIAAGSVSSARHPARRRDTPETPGAPGRSTAACLDPKSERISGCRAGAAAQKRRDDIAGNDRLAFEPAKETTQIKNILSWMGKGHSAAKPARHLLTGSSVDMLSSLKNAMALVTGLAGPLCRRVAGRGLRRSEGGARRESPVGWRCVAAVLALGLGLSGVSPCLCVAEPAQTSDPHACCAHSAGPGGGVPTDGTSGKTSATPCCTSPTAAGLTARLDDRDVLRHTLVAAVARAIAPERQVALSTVGVSAASLQHFPPLRTTVLRI